MAQAECLPNGTLVAACVSTGWWNLYAVDTSTGERRPLHPAAEEFAGLQRMGLRWFRPLPDGRLAVLRGVGAQRLAVLDPERGELTDVPGPADEWLPHLDAAGDRIVGVAASNHLPYTVVEVDTATPALLTSRYAPGFTVDSAYLPLPVPRVFHGPGPPGPRAGTRPAQSPVQCQ
ncbi:hypothetical protein ACWDZ8_27570 [Streptomyces sp. NPDC003233]